MLHSTILSHVFLAVFLYICTVAALTDRELEKIINTAVSGEELKDYRRYPDLEDLEDFKTNLDGLENLNEEGPEDFGSVETENVDDGMYGVDMRDKRAVEMENLDKEDRSEVVNRDNTHRRSNSLVKRFTATKHSAVPFKAHEADIIKRSTRQNEDKANTILDKVRQCLLDDSCLKRHVDKLIAKDASKDKFRIRTRNVFCNRRGCGRRKRSPSGQDQGQRQKRDTVRNGQVRKRNFMCNRFGCTTKTKRHALDNDFYETQAKRHMSVSDGIELLSLLDILKQNPDNSVQESTPDSYVPKLSDRSGSELYDLSDRAAASSRLLDSLSGNDDDLFRRIPVNQCGMNTTCGKRLSRLIAQGFYEVK